MAIINYDRIKSKTPISSPYYTRNGIPVVTTDEVATAIQVDEEGDVTGFTSLTDKLAGLSASGHKHAASDITSGKLDIARIPTGSTSASVALGNHNHDDIYAKKTDVPSIPSLSLSGTGTGNVISGLSVSGHKITYQLSEITGGTTLSLSSKTAGTKSLTSTSAEFTIVSDVTLSGNVLTVTKQTISLRDLVQNIYNTINSYHDVPTPTQATLSVSPTTLSFSSSAAKTITVTANGCTPNVVSSNTSVATVTGSGSTWTVTPKANGSATLTVSGAAQSGYSAPSNKSVSVSVNIAAPVSYYGIIVTPTNNLTVGGKTAHEAVLVETSNNNQITNGVSWSSANTNIVTINDGGRLTAVGTNNTSLSSATVNISALINGNVVATTPITVNRGYAALTPDDTTINVVDGLYNGQQYYTISNITSTSPTSGNPIVLNLNTTTSAYFANANGSTTLYVSSGTNQNVIFNGSTSGNATVTISQAATTAYNAPTNKVITFNFSKSTPTTTYKYYVGTTEPKALKINSLGTTTTKSEWSTVKSVSHTNASGVSSPIYYCFPTDWNMIFYDEDKVSEVALASVSTFTSNGVKYTVLKTGRNVSNGSGKDYYAKAN